MWRLARSLAWRVLNATQLLVLGGWTVCWISLALLVTAARGDAATSLAMARRLWAPGVLAGLGIRLRVSGTGRLEPHRRAVFVANHRSNLDVPALFAALPWNLRFLVKAELARVPFLGWYVRGMGMVLTDRGQATSARRCLASVTQLLSAGHSLVAFPEGSRSTARGVRPFKAGVFAAAIATGTPIVPVAIHGSGEAWPPHTFVARPGTVLVEIGEPLETAGLRRRDNRQLAATARQRIRDLLGQAGLEPGESSPAVEPS
jgi:1-acyl-sn-glycerol-3-phosphate acyltransferase